MRRKRYAQPALAAITILWGLAMTGCASHPGDAIAVAQQGSFFVGGKKVQGPGTYDPTQGTTNTDPGQTY